MQLYLVLLVALSFIGLSEQSCKVVAKCDGKSSHWVNAADVIANGQENEAKIAPGPEMHYLGHKMTYNTGRSFCSNLGKRLCLAKELCADENGAFNFLFDVIPGDHWAPVLDSDNEWVEIGDSYARTCYVHSQYYGKPPWGTSTGASPHKGFTFCCENNDIVEAIKYQYAGNKTTYQSSIDYCTSQKRRLCRIDEVCSKNTPVFGVVNGDMWVAVADEENEWVEVGDSAGRTCWVHGKKYGPPTWGDRTDDTSRSHVGYVYCCKG